MAGGRRPPPFDRPTDAREFRNMTKKYMERRRRREARKRAVEWREGGKEGKS